MGKSEGQTLSDRPKPGKRYSWYVLFVLVIVYVFNFIDRQILSILNEDIKADLGLTDAQMGFLFGTAFAVFYAIFGIPLGRLADMWVRRKMIAVGLFFWSLMTALSGTARGFAGLATFRIGVGIGESSASPAAYSMLGDFFPPRLRATAVAIYSSGIYIGAGLGMLIGGQIVGRWNTAFPDSSTAPLGLVGWQAAFFAVGLPGMIMALWVWTLREPIRGQSEGLPPPKRHPSPFKEFATELSSVLPPLTLITLGKLGGSSAVLVNLVGAFTIVCSVLVLISLVGSPSQWVALGIGLYSFFSWIQGLRIRDRVAFELIFKCPSLMFGIVGFAWCAFVGYGVGYWTAPYFIRVHGESPAQVGTYLGLTAMGAGWFGVTLSGVVSDFWKVRSSYARLNCGMISAALSVPSGYVLFTTNEVEVAYLANIFFTTTSCFWIGSAIAMTNELVLPRMRATASATYILIVTFIGLALGPFVMGQVSTTLTDGGGDPGMALRSGVLYGLFGYLFAMLFFLASARSLVRDEGRRIVRARDLGEDV